MSEGHYNKVQLCCLNLERGGLEPSWYFPTEVKSAILYRKKRRGALFNLLLLMLYIKNYR
jgi:hypothetical protein